jgi:hypothetical protein
LLVAGKLDSQRSRHPPIRPQTHTLYNAYSLFKL